MEVGDDKGLHPCRLHAEQAGREEEEVGWSGCVRGGGGRRWRRWKGRQEMQECSGDYGNTS